MTWATSSMPGRHGVRRRGYARGRRYGRTVRWRLHAARPRHRAFMDGFERVAQLIRDVDDVRHVSGEGTLTRGGPIWKDAASLTSRPEC